jgi:hypothetical protein
VHASHHGHAACHRPGHHAATTLTAESVQAPVTAGRRRCPCRGGPYSVTRAQRRVPPLSLPPRLLLTLRSASLLPTALLCVASHLYPPSSPTKPGNRTAVTPSMCSNNHEPESPANDSEKSHSLSYRLPLTVPPSTAAVRAPPASPPRPGGLRESVVQPRLHLHRRRPAV